MENECRDPPLPGKQLTGPCLSVIRLSDRHLTGRVTLRHKCGRMCALAERAPEMPRTAGLGGRLYPHPRSLAGFPAGLRERKAGSANVVAIKTFPPWVPERTIREFRQLPYLLALKKATRMGRTVVAALIAAHMLPLQFANAGELEDAIMAGNQAQVEALLARGVQVN